MNCPNKKSIQNLVDGDLKQDEITQILQHIRSCQACKTELNELLSLHNALNKMVDKDECPSLETIESYIENRYSEEQTAKIAEHLDICGHCKSYVWALQASETELAKWQKEQEQACREFEASELGYDTAKETFSRLLPGKIDLVDKIWQSSLNFVIDLRDKAIENWPSFNQETRLVGVLGFADSYTPEAEAASIIMATAIYISQAISDGDLEPCAKDVESAIEIVATKLGAGKELRKRLIETIPPLVLKKDANA